jgi:hypothetical protein
MGKPHTVQNGSSPAVYQKPSGLSGLNLHAVYKPLIFRNFGLGAASGRIADSHSKPRKPQAHEHHPEPQSLP